ncbi:PREDICTED: xin actin-binding repeat-containing protein 1-like [Nanorana parkeri]|uniref:xin actin-binding repeat-containing protein 1-like n=1 Tax=Nanorana parkeri TaxID=125878 RepID=UPI000854C5EB|nr:PREDICTED: xin actin-binding repeat-containing protein 1-like [Nanorana parkeri]
MADNIMKSSQEKKFDANLPLPPPPESAHHTVMVTGAQDQGYLPPPPPKESFSKFYEQRQVNELKRLYRHMHPELRKNLEHAVTRDINELLSTDEPNQPASVNLDAGLPVEVQSMRWIFENWKLDTIGEHQRNRKLTEEEDVLGGNVRNTSLMFQGQTCVDDKRSSAVILGTDQRKGDVKTALWLFETQPLDSLNKIYPEGTEVQEAVLKDTVEKGDVKGTKMLFETQSLDEVGRCNSVEENSILQLKSEIQEMKGDVNKTIKLFQTEPLCAIRDKTGNIHEIKSVCREETQSNNVNTARWLFETQPLDSIHKDTSKVQIIRGISLEEIAKGGVNATKWVFETQPLDTIKEHIEEGVFQASGDTIQEGDISKHCNVFEQEYLDSINGNADIKTATREEIVAGDVKSTLWLFETQPMETIKGSLEVGQMKKVELSSEEKGDVKQRKHVFETCSLDKISNKEESSEQTEEDTKDIVKGEVKSFKNLFETLPLDSIKSTQSVQVSNEEDIRAGNVKATQALFENTPLYAIEDSLGNYHEVTSVSREQIVSGDVKNYKWMFETKPLDQFNDGTQKVDLIKGITKQEIVSGDVGTARWLFETQPVDVFSKDEQCATQKEVLQKGDVKKCRWLFETQPIDILYDKSEKPQKEALVQGDVKSYTWMFETQPLDSIKDSEEHYIKVSSASQSDLECVNVKTTKHLFETEPLDSISASREFPKMIRYASRVEIQTGEVSRVKEIFETMPPEQVPLCKTDIPTEENIQVGSVNKFTWLFENCPMDSIQDNKNSFQELPPEKDTQGGDVGGKKFIFETFSLDQIHQEFDEKEVSKVQETLTKADVKSCTMLFETKPLYAIQDKSGDYHEVTSVKKEEIHKGDVRGAKWLFETKPFDRINKDEEVFIIRAVTQEDIEKGCVKAARWRFETEPLDTITDIAKHAVRTVDDIQKGDVQVNKQLFETEQVSQKKYVRLVSVSDVQKGNVRTSTWLFENQPIDTLKGEDQEHQGIIKVQREDSQKGDVKRCTWLFESQPLDSLKDMEDTVTPQTMEVIPKANVKSTTWLFESTPIDKIDLKYSTSTQQSEINIKDSLDAFLSCKIIQNKGIVIENIHGGNVKMIKYQLSTQTKVDIQKEETVGGNLQRILLQLLHRTDVEPHGLLVEETDSRHLQITKLNMLNTIQSKEEDTASVKDDVAKALNILRNENDSYKTGIIMEESERGSVKIIIYSLSSHCNFNKAGEVVAKGDVKSTIGSQLLCGQDSKPKLSVTHEQNEKGSVQLYTSCIEKGDLGYLKSLQAESEIDALTLSQKDSVNQETTSTEQQGTAVQKDNQSTRNPECVYIAPTPVFYAVQPQQQLQKCRTVDTTEATNNQKATTGCKLEKQDITLNNSRKISSIVQKSTAMGKACGDKTDLQAALLDLRQVTAEATSIQKQVQCKIQKTNQEVQLTKQDENTVKPVQATLHQECASAKHIISVTTKAQETRTSYASLQKSTTSTKKVSVSQEEEEKEAAQRSREISVAGDNSFTDNSESPKQVKNYLNPFIDDEYTTQLEQEERDQEIVRGDVKAAIRALQNASTEQKVTEKEEVVKGNLTSALQSLQKSNVNVSKGDFKAAMIYRNAGQSYATRKKKDNEQQIKNETFTKSVQPSDIDSPPSSAAVTGQEKCQPSNTSNADSTKDDSEKMNDPVPKFPGPITQKASENTSDKNAKTFEATQRKKPVPPPKPKHLLPGKCPPPRYRAKAPMTSTPASSPPPTIPTGNCSTILTCPGNESKQENEVSKKEIFSHNTDLKFNERHRITTKSQIFEDECTSMPKTTLVSNEKACTAVPGQLEPISEDKSTIHKPIENKDKAPDKTSITLTESKDCCNHSDTKGVVMRVKKRKETEDEKRKRLSIHMDEIMKDNVKAATDIFENLRKQDELEMILKKVEELEEETSNVDVTSVRGLFETVPDWIASSKERATPLLKQQEGRKDESFEMLKDDTESVSSVELAFEDLERASVEIKYLKEQTLARLLDIEETVKKALYSVSSLKSESDIASLSSLFRESLETSSSTTNNIRKISIVSSKSKPEKTTQSFGQKYVDAVNSQEVTENKKRELEVNAVPSRLSPTSPSFISIESTARKSLQQNGNCSSSTTISNKNGQDCTDPFVQLSISNDNGQCPSASHLGIPAVYEPNAKVNINTPSSPGSQRQKSVLELKTGPEGPKVIGTTIVTEKYEESDQFGNKIIRSKTSTTVTKQSDAQTSSTYEVVSATPRYEVTASPLLRRHVTPPVENSNSQGNDTGVVFVTFANSKPAKK